MRSKAARPGASRRTQDDIPHHSDISDPRRLAAGSAGQGCGQGQDQLMPGRKPGNIQKNRADQVFPTLRARRWYDGLMPRTSEVRGPASPRALSRPAFTVLVILASLSCGVLALGVLGGPIWFYGVGLVGILLSVALSWMFMRSLERRLWAAFFAALTGAAVSLAGPSVVLDIAAAGSAAGVVTANGDVAGSLSWGANPWIALVLLAMAALAGWIALQVRRG